MSQQNSLNINEYTNFIWKIADLLRGDYKQSEYGDVVLPFTVLCRLDSVLLATKDKVLEIDKTSNFGDKVKEKLFEQATGMKFYNKSNFTFKKLKDDAPNIAENLRDYITSFSANVQEIMEAFNIYAQIERLDKAGLLYMVISKYADEIDLSPKKVPNDLMGYIFEELIRRFSEISNETAGEHFTPREVIRLMVSLIFNEDGSELSEDGKMTSLYDPAAGTGGMLAIGSDYLKSLNQTIYVDCYGQELNPMTYAVCKSDMLIKGQQYDRIYRGNSFTEDGTAGKTFSYMLCNPPFGVEWKKYDKFIKEENEKLGFAGRFGAGLPRISDGSFLFLQHMISKMKPVDEGGSRIAIVFNGSPLFAGDAGSGESEIRRWIIENDWLETIVALPDQMFYNTPISTFIWIVTNRKSVLRRGKIQLINAESICEKARKALGKKKNQISDSNIATITKLHAEFSKNDFSLIFENEDFKYQKHFIEQPLRLNFSFEKSRIDKLAASKEILKIQSGTKTDDKHAVTTLMDTLYCCQDKGVYKSSEEFVAALKQILAHKKLRLKSAVIDLTVKYLGEKDAGAQPFKTKKDTFLADPALRTSIKVFSKESIIERVANEITPYLPDAWIDFSRTKEGYEILIPRYFFKSSPTAVVESLNANEVALAATVEDYIQKMSFDSNVLYSGVNGQSAIAHKNLDWILKVPKHWEIIKAKHLFKLRNERGNEVPVLLAASQKYGMIPQSEIDGVVQVSESADLQGFRTVMKGDFVISLRSFQGGFEMSDYDGVCSPAYQVFCSKGELYLPYFKWVFKSTPFIKKINSLTIGIRDGKNILFDDFGEVYLAVPAYQEQIDIINKIYETKDSVTKQIKNMISKYAMEICVPGQRSDS